MTASLWVAGCELLGGEDTEESNLNNQDYQSFDTSTPEGTVKGFLHVLPSGDLYEWDKYLVPKGSSSGASGVAKEFAKEFVGVQTADISIEISNIMLEELWSTGSEVAIRTTYILNKKVNGEKTSLPHDYTFLLEKFGEDWLITDCSDVPLAPPDTPAPTPSPTPEFVVPGTPVSTGTITPVEAGEILLYDDFSSRSNVWPIYSGKYGIAYYNNGTLRVKHRGILQSPEICVARQSFDNFVLRLDTALVEGNEDSWIIVAFRTDYWGNGYRFMISADGRYAIDAYNKKSGSNFLQEPVFSEHINAGYDALNQLRIECVDDAIRFSVNEHLLNAMRDSTFISGAIALGVSTTPETGGAEAMFDNLMVNAPLGEVTP